MNILLPQQRKAGVGIEGPKNVSVKQQIKKIDYVLSDN